MNHPSSGAIVELAAMNMIKNIFGKKDDTSQDTTALEQAEAAGDIIVSPDARRFRRVSGEKAAITRAETRGRKSDSTGRDIL